MRWELVEYTWDPNTGLAELIYERVRPDTEEIVTRKETRTHTRWFTKRRVNEN